MGFNKAQQKQFAEKPDTLAIAPGTLIKAEPLAELLQIPKLAVGEMSGMHSLAPVCRCLAAERPDAFLPVIDYKGIEYGNWHGLVQQMRRLKAIAQKELHIYVIDPVVIGSPPFWRALNSTFRQAVSKRFGFWSPCCGCLVYSLAIRIPLCKQVQAAGIVSEKVFSRTGNCRMAGCATASKYGATLLSSFGLELWQADRYPVDECEAGYPENGHGDMFCMMEETDQAIVAPERLVAFYEMYALPAAARIISRVLSGTLVDYDREVKDTLQIKKG